jgi:hypothetical protein
VREVGRQCRGCLSGVEIDQWKRPQRCPADRTKGIRKGITNRMRDRRGKHGQFLQTIALGHLRKSRADWIRTSDLLVPNQALYQTEPQPEGDTRCLGERNLARQSAVRHSNRGSQPRQGLRVRATSPRVNFPPFRPKSLLLLPNQAKFRSFAGCESSPLLRPAHGCRR